MSALDFFRSNGMASEHIRSALQLPTCVPPPAVHSLGWVMALRPPRAAARCRLGLPSLREPPCGRASAQGPDQFLGVLARTRAVEPRREAVCLSCPGCSRPRPTGGACGRWGSAPGARFLSRRRAARPTRFVQGF